MVMKPAYYTVEATFVVSICVWVLFALIYGGCYVHDRMVLGSITNEMTAKRFQNGEKKVTEKWEKKVKKKLDKHLFVMRVSSVEGKKKTLYVKMTVSYRLVISSDMIKHILSSGSEGTKYVTKREIVKPMETKWDYDMLTEG